MKKATLILLVLLLVTVLSGCLEYKDKMKINRDGSGELTFSFGINEAMLGMGGENDFNDINPDSIKNNFENKAGIRYLGSRDYSEDGIRWIETSVAFDSPESLKKAMESSKQGGIIGDIELVPQGDEMLFTRTISAGKDEQDSTENFGKNMAAMMFGNFKWKYTVVLPSKVTGANTEKENIDTDHNSVTWVFPMSEMISKPHTLQATFTTSKPPVTNFVMIVGMICVVIVIGLYAYERKKKAAKAK